MGICTISHVVVGGESNLERLGALRRVRWRAIRGSASTYSRRTRTHDCRRSSLASKNQRKAVRGQCEERSVVAESSRATKDADDTRGSTYRGMEERRHEHA